MNKERLCFDYAADQRKNRDFGQYLRMNNRKATVETWTLIDERIEDFWFISISGVSWD